MIKSLVCFYRQNSFIESHRFLLIYAHVIALIHGIGFITQKAVENDSIIKYALINTDAWHGGLPAISLFNISFISGVFTILLSIVSMYLIMHNLHFKWHWPLMVALFFSGGGFVYFFITLITRISLRINKHIQHNKPTIFKETLLITLLIWLFASWILGWIFPLMMLQISLVLFLLFDVLIPIIIIWVHRMN